VGNEEAPEKVVVVVVVAVVVVFAVAEPAVTIDQVVTIDEAVVVAASVAVAVVVDVVVVGDEKVVIDKQQAYEGVEGDNVVVAGVEDADVDEKEVDDVDSRASVVDATTEAYSTAQDLLVLDNPHPKYRAIASNPTEQHPCDVDVVLQH